MGSDNSKEFIPPDYPRRTNTYNEQWASEIRSRSIATDSTITPATSGDGDGDEIPPTFSPEKLGTLYDRAKDLYDTIDTENHPAKLKALLACLGQVWAGVQLIRAVFALYEEEKNEFDELSNKIDANFAELRARDSVIRIRKRIWKIERLLNLPNLTSSENLDSNVNLLMRELMQKGPTSALEEVYASLGGGHRSQMERYILHVLHFLFNGINKNNELLRREYEPSEYAEYIGKQYSAEMQSQIVDNVCKILGRFDEELDTNLKKDFAKHLYDFDFLVSKYDWLHLHRTENDQANNVYRSNNFAPCIPESRGRRVYWLHYIPKDIWIDPTDEEIASARCALSEAKDDFTRGTDPLVLIAKRLNQRQLAWWGVFYGNKYSDIKFSGGYPTRCSVVEVTYFYGWEWRVLLCGRS